LQGIGAALLILGTFILVEARRGDGALMLLAMFAMPTFVGLTLLTLPPLFEPGRLARTTASPSQNIA